MPEDDTMKNENQRPIPSYRVRDGHIWYHFYFKGKRYRRSTKCKPHETDRAERITKDLIDSLMFNLMADGTNPRELPAAELFRMYNRRPTKRGQPKNPATILNYERYAKRFLDKFGALVNLTDINQWMIEDWRNDLLDTDSAYEDKGNKKLSPKLVAEHINWISAVYKVFNLPNPCVNVTRPKKTHAQQVEDLQYYSKSELKRLLEVSRNLHLNGQRGYDEFYSWLRLMAETGIRIGEAMNIRLKDIKWSQNAIYVWANKRSAGRLLQFPDDAGDWGTMYLTYLLLDRVFRDEFGFEAPDIRLKKRLESIGAKLEELQESHPDFTLWRYTYWWFAEHLKHVCKECGIPYKSPHALRHSFATIAMHSPDWTISYLAQWLGHKDISTTYKFYGHLGREERPPFSLS